MPAWWDSIDSVSTFTLWMRWIGIGLTMLGAVFGALAITSSNRVDNLKAKRDAAERDKAAQLAKEATERTGKIETDLGAQTAKAEASENKLRELRNSVPRQITLEQRMALVAALKPYAGQRVMIAQLRATNRKGYPEIEGIAEQISDALWEAGWKVASGTWHKEYLLDKGIKELAPGMTPLFFKADKPSQPFLMLINELRKANFQILEVRRGPAEGDRHFDDEYTEVILIGKKPEEK